jgi:homopolymeric O-antigen transport system ATP-binding protein
MRPIIKVDKLSKQYRIGDGQQAAYSTAREALMSAIRSPFKALRSNGNNESAKIWAVRDVSFEVKPGEVVGIIGRNGAGKSTLLKVLSRITEPTSGRVELYGRVGSLLEVGTGFHSELTGRENIYLNGSILGMSRQEVEAQFDEMVSFSEIGKFIDTPVKRYSSGMYLRLAFAVAAHLEPEILIVDEVLAVGDAAFQKKCVGKMSAVAREGRTVLFVSHNMTAVQSLCQRAIWLNEGRVLQDGSADQVVSNYLTHSFSPLAEQVWDDVLTAPGNEQVRIHKAAVRPLEGTAVDRITIRDPLMLEFEFWNLVPDARLNLSLGILNEGGVHIFQSDSTHNPEMRDRPFPVGLFRCTCYIPGDLLNDTTHRVQLLVVRDQASVVYRHEDILMFDVNDAVERRGEWYGKWPGAVRPQLEWKLELVSSGSPVELQAR